MEVDLNGLQYLESSIDRLNDSIIKQNVLMTEQVKLFSQLVNLIDYQMHLDYQSRTGRKLVTPFDSEAEGTEIEEERLNEDETKQMIINFIEEKCLRSRYRSCTASRLYGEIMTYFRKKGYATPRACEIEEIVKELGKTYSYEYINSGISPKYSGITVIE